MGMAMKNKAKQSQFPGRVPTGQGPAVASLDGGWGSGRGGLNPGGRAGMMGRPGGWPGRRTKAVESDTNTSKGRQYGTLKRIGLGHYAA